MKKQKEHYCCRKFKGRLKNHDIFDYLNDELADPKKYYLRFYYGESLLGGGNVFHAIEYCPFCGQKLEK